MGIWYQFWGYRRGPGLLVPKWAGWGTNIPRQTPSRFPGGPRALWLQTPLRQSAPNSDTLAGAGICSKASPRVARPAGSSGQALVTSTLLLEEPGLLALGTQTGWGGGHHPHSHKEVPAQPGRALGGGPAQAWCTPQPYRRRPEPRPPPHPHCWFSSGRRCQRSFVAAQRAGRDCLGGAPGARTVGDGLWKKVKNRGKSCEGRRSLLPWSRCRPSPGLGPGRGPRQLPGPLRVLWGQTGAHLLPPRAPVSPQAGVSSVGRAVGCREPDEGRRGSCSLQPRAKGAGL